ncbi:hypothetical protein NDU88_004580 [Pleurodeles waltl]|uniref:Uncharacterized protein n=1 Tax=Pleurodeles waltl TaxID=8319 RepID=A0AAV7M8R8_PLEWA|nr:hypothetical protein NDU88_004580 [Pleurodeles waltl]
MESEYIQAALSLLKKAGRMDLLRQVALPALRPARKATQGVAAAVMACSPQRAGARLGQVRRGGRGGGRLSPGKRGRVVSRPAGPSAELSFVTGKRRGGADFRKEHRLAKGRRGAPPRVAASRDSCAPSAGDRQDGETGVQRTGVVQGEQPGGGEDLDIMQVVDAAREEREDGLSAERDGEYDPLVPISRKWPTILEWSATESEGEEMEVRGDPRRGASPNFIVHWGAPRKVYGKPAKKGSVKLSVEGPGGPGVRSGQRGLLGAQGGPRFFEATRTRRRWAADTPGEPCGGRGLAPASAAASWERRPGPSKVHAGVRKRRTVGTTATAAELPRRAQEALGYGNDFWMSCLVDQIGGTFRAVNYI